MSTATLTPLEEERAAARQLRHMEKMHREAERVRERERRAVQRAAVRELEKQRAVAQSASRSAMRAYERALTAYSTCSAAMEDLRGRQLDAAYNRAQANAGEVRFIERKLVEARRG